MSTHGEHPAVWEKKGANLFTVRNVTRYRELRVSTNRLLNKIEKLGGFVFYVGIKKTAAPAEHDPNQLYKSVLVEAIKRIDAIWFTARLNTLFLGLVGLVFVAFARPIVELLATDPAVVAIAATCLRIVACSYVFWGFGLVTVVAFNGAGDTTTPTWINFLVYCWCSSRSPGRLRARPAWGRAGCS